MQNTTSTAPFSEGIYISLQTKTLLRFIAKRKGVPVTVIADIMLREAAVRWYPNIEQVISEHNKSMGKLMDASVELLREQTNDTDGAKT